MVRSSLDADAAVALQVCEARCLGADADSLGLLGSVAGPRYQSNRSERLLWGRFALGGHNASDRTQASVWRSVGLLSAVDSTGRCNT